MRSDARPSKPLTARSSPSPKGTPEGHPRRRLGLYRRGVAEPLLCRIDTEGSEDRILGLVVRQTLTHADKIKEAASRGEASLALRLDPPEELFGGIQRPLLTKGVPNREPSLKR